MLSAGSPLVSRVIVNEPKAHMPADCYKPLDSPTTTYVFHLFA